MTLQQLLGIELPIIQAPMAGVQGSALAVAVSKAGGLGSLPCAMLSLAAIGDELAAIRAQTDRPFNLNFFCHTPPVPDAAREAAWRAALAPYYAELGIDAATIPAAARPGSLQRRDGRPDGAVQARGRELPLRPAAGRAAGARRAGARRCCRRPPPSTRRGGWPRAASMRSSRRAWRRAGIAACS